MHLTAEARPIDEIAPVPAELCRLVHRMLEKDPTLRPGAIELRQIARALALEIATAYESIEIITETPRLPRAVRPRRHIALAAQPSDEAVVVDPDTLELGTTEMMPAFRKPRWTPEIGYSRGRVIAPRGLRDQVAGEINKRR
jgi:hypothetical protein